MGMNPGRERRRTPCLPGRDARLGESRRACHTGLIQTKRIHFRLSRIGWRLWRGTPWPWIHPRGLDDRLPAGGTAARRSPSLPSDAKNWIAMSIVSDLLPSEAWPA